MGAHTARDDQKTPRPAVRGIGERADRLWGLTPMERLARMAARAGLADCAGESAGFPAGGSVLLVRLDHVIEEALLRRLAERPGVLLVHEAAEGTFYPVAVHVGGAQAPAVAAALHGRLDDPRLAGLEAMTAAVLASSYNSALRKREVPYVLPLDALPRSAVERRMFGAAYKGVTDFVTKWLWPRPALLVTRWCAERGVTPNAVTALSLAFVFLALWLFAIGEFAGGLLAAWIMTFLDTVDGKLARVTLTSSRFGNAFDHGIDLIHPPIWWWAWWHGIAAAALPAWVAGLLDPAGWVVIVGYVAGRLIEGFFLWRFKMEIHSWRRIDSLFRLVTARRNPNLVLLTAATVAGRPDLGFLLVALWTLLSLVFHLVRVGQAIARSRADGGLRSWLSEPARAPA